VSFLNLVTTFEPLYQCFHARELDLFDPIWRVAFVAFVMFVCVIILP
jgi:hypothetical protein